MAYTKRFLGSGENELVGVNGDFYDELKLPDRYAVEVTFRCHQQRYLMRPDAEATQIILGSFGRALHPERRSV